MGCSGCGRSRYSPEYRKYKPENTTGCCNPINRKCDGVSNAVKDSPLWNWEQEYGKLLTTVTFVQDEYGHTVQKVEKTPCPKSNPQVKISSCCKIIYKS